VGTLGAWARSVGRDSEVIEPEGIVGRGCASDSPFDAGGFSVVLD